MSILCYDAKDDLLLSLMIEKVEYAAKTYLRAFEEKADRETYSIPLAFAVSRGMNPVIQKEWSRRTKWHLEGKCNSEDQERAFAEALAYLDKTHTCIMSLHVGFGKTFMALKLAAHIGLKTLIIVPTSKKILQQQWVEEAARFLPDARVQLLSSSTQLDARADIFIAGSHTVLNIWKKVRYVPFVIVDELHLVLSSKGYRCLLHISPLYMLGLSATPYRLDGSNKLIELFFGANQVFKKLSRDYTVNVIYTPFQFKMEKTERGTINWGAILNQQAVCEERNDLIADIICTNKSIKFLVLCKRVDQIKELSQKCRERGIAVQAVYQDIAPQKDSRTLIGSIQKLGTGFSDNTFRGLIIAADVQDYFIQYFGRVLRAPDTCPAIYDLIDDNHIMRQHFAERRAIYESSGGTLKTVRASSLKRATM